MTVSPSADLELMRASLLLESNPAAAARRASDILQSSPGHPEANLLLATACRKLGDPQAAAAVLTSLAAAHPDSAVIRLELGRAQAAAGQPADALASLKRAVALDGGLADAWRELAAQLFAGHDTQAGDAAYREYDALTPEPPELTDASVALSDNRLDAAEAMLRRRLAQMPADVVALRMLADVATRRDDFAEAERCLTEALRIAPGLSAARFDLARLLYSQQKTAAMLPLVERLLALEPSNIDYMSLKAQALRFVGGNQEATALMDRAVTEHPQEDRAWLLYGHLLREAGEQARAIEMYRQALKVRPECTRAYSSLANLKTFRFAAADLAAMQELLTHSTVRGTDRIYLEFALGKALEDEREFAASFEHYASGNTLQRATLTYDADATTADVHRSDRVYDAAFFAARAGWGSSQADPIFIVGLPRSGSTLLEQVLASHSQIEGTRELPDVPAIVFELLAKETPSRRQTYPEPIAALGRDEIEDMAQRYLARTQAHRPLGKPRFVDKMLGNFGHIGLIHLMFPRAAIIDARRHPLGCGFSCYKQLFARGIPFSYDLGELGRYYRDYAALMEHFDSVLPGRVHRVHYEQLVADPQGELQRLLDYCALPFEEQCLRFHENRRIVQTLSSEQVRRPIYSESVDQWRHYEPWLTPLKAPLGDLVERYPTPRPATREGDTL